MTENTNTRGYDDSKILAEMATGVVDGTFSSVDLAAKTVSGEPSGSNVDRLRRKFREQGWYQRGLDEYVAARLTGNREHGAERLTEITKRAMAVEAPKRTWSGVTAFLERWAASIPMSMYAGCMVLALMLVPFIHTSKAVEDPETIATENRASAFAVNAYQQLYDLSFNSDEVQESRNVRFFLTPGAYIAYLDDLKERGIKDKVHDSLLVYRSEIVGTPRANVSLSGTTVAFNVSRTTSDAQANDVTCYRVEVFADRNTNFGLAAAEFGLMAPPRIEEMKSCKDAETVSPVPLALLPKG